MNKFNETLTNLNELSPSELEQLIGLAWEIKQEKEQKYYEKFLKNGFSKDYDFLMKADLKMKWDFIEGEGDEKSWFFKEDNFGDVELMDIYIEQILWNTWYPEGKEPIRGE